jgi:hypothetical protein
VSRRFLFISWKKTEDVVVEIGFGLRGIGIWQTVCMVSFADYVKAA